MAYVAIGLGSNLGDRQAHLLAANWRLSDILSNISVSCAYHTPPVGYTDQPAYLNAVIKGHTELDALDLLRQLKQLEREIGRTNFVSGRPREIDLDLLLYDEQRINSPNGYLVVPHPQLHERWFALAPLVELWPQARHAVLDQTVSQLLQRLERPAGVEQQIISWQQKPLTTN